MSAYICIYIYKHIPFSILRTLATPFTTKKVFKIHYISSHSHQRYNIILLYTSIDINIYIYICRHSQYIYTSMYKNYSEYTSIWQKVVSNLKHEMNVTFRSVARLNFILLYFFFSVRSAVDAVLYFLRLFLKNWF